MVKSKITPELLEKISEAKKKDPEGRIPVIITLESGADVSVLEELGFVVENSFPEINALAGTVSANKVGMLAEFHAVKAIEYDSKVYAL